MAELMQTARMIVAELERRDIAVEADIPESVSMLRFNYAGKQRLIIGTVPAFACAHTTEICRSKLMTEWVISRQTSIAMPDTLAFSDMSNARDFLRLHDSIVVKPQDGSHGQGVTVAIADNETLEKAIQSAREVSRTDSVLLQEMMQGTDVRVLVLDGRAISALYRFPPKVVGDGSKTLRQLIEHENATNPDRGEQPYTKALNKIDMAAAERFLGESINGVLSAGEERVVVGAANIGAGGSARECLWELPDAMKRDAIEAANAVGAFVCGVDFMYDTTTGSYKLIELNSSPSFGRHDPPSKEPGFTVARMFVDAVLNRYDGGQ